MKPKTLQSIKDRCRISECGCWIWTGATSNGGTRPNIYGPDYTRGKWVYQTGPRAVWHIKTKAPIPQGHRVFRTCDEPLCVNPAHLECMPFAEWGKRVAEAGEWRGQVARILANRKSARRRTPLTPELIEAVNEREGSSRKVAEEMGLTKTSVIRARAGLVKCYQPIGMFTGLLGATA